jgi:CRISPR-associated protein Cas1
VEYVIDLSDAPASLSVRCGQLIIKADGREDSVPLAEILVLVVSHPVVRYTHAVLSGICEAGGAVVLCNEKRLPCGMLLPLVSHVVQTERLSAQVGMSLPLKKQLWKQIISAKVAAQGRLLAARCAHDAGLVMLAGKVRSGDEGNVEAMAARRYWQTLLGESFRREPRSGEAINTLLDYGYGVLRAVVARAICAIGFHPSLGLHHHNRYDPFCLADDMMEPFRPLVDEAVLSIVDKRGRGAPLDKESKAVLIGQIVQRRFSVDGEERKLFDIVNRAAGSLAAVALGKRKKLLISGIENAAQRASDI